MLFSYEQGTLSSIEDQSSRQTVRWLFKNGHLADLMLSSDGKTVHALHYDYDALGRLSHVSRDLGNGSLYWIAYDYEDDSSRIAMIRQSDGTSLTITYDALGRVATMMDGEGRLSRFVYGNGWTTVTNELGETWTCYYDERRRLTGIDGPEHYRIRYEYQGDYLSRIIQGEQYWSFFIMPVVIAYVLLSLMAK